MSGEILMKPETFVKPGCAAALIKKISHLKNENPNYFTKSKAGQIVFCPAFSSQNSAVLNQKRRL
jgi:hypothetical protein